jgi:hypothetical protein
MSASQPVDYVNNMLAKDGLITAAYQKDEGLFVKALKNLDQGTNVMECLAAGNIALDPQFRSTNCGFCAQKHEKLRMCPTCHVVGWCPQCAASDAVSSTSEGSTGTTASSPAPKQHANECEALRALGDLFSQTTATPEDGPAAAIDSTHLLTVRLLCQCNTSHLDWELGKCLYAMPTMSIDAATIMMICAHLQVPPLNTWLGNDIYQAALARVIGCSHAITDVSLPLGNQSVGRGLFLQHSFYNHSCTPNAFLSCQLMTSPSPAGRSSCGVKARLHLLSNVKKGDAITISYIPTSGLAFQERQQRLQDGYGFNCKCDACTHELIKLPLGVDVDSIREIQFSCNERLLLQEEAGGNSINEDEIEHVISLAQMTKRGIQNQQVPANHEVSIEADRLLAMAYSVLLTQNKTSEETRRDATLHHDHFFQEAISVGKLFDPVVIATERLKYAKLLEGDSKQQATMQREMAMNLLQTSLGDDHPWVRHLTEEQAIHEVSTALPQIAKRQKTQEA